LKINTRYALLGAALLASTSGYSSTDNTTDSVDARLAKLTARYSAEQHAEYRDGKANALVVGGNFRIEGCDQYPHHEQTSSLAGFNVLLSDMEQGLQQGLSCLAGHSPAGKLHPFHARQADALLRLLESPLPKTVRCVADKTYAYAIARLPPSADSGSEHFETVAADIRYPGIVIDTYRISGYLSRRHEVAVYRDFFKLDARAIDRHLNVKPQWFEGMHRYRNRASLLFHEMVHWLGHTHGNTYPDVVHLYETCCFQGSDFIQSAEDNARFRDQACAILKDDELWQANRYKQMRLWAFKGYDQLKPDMRQAYD
jgi:hypothetical protein